MSRMNVTRFRNALRDASLSQIEIAEALGLSQSQISKKLREPITDIVFVLRVADLINLPVREIFPNLSEELYLLAELIDENNAEAAKYLLEQRPLIEISHDEGSEPTV